MSAHTDTLDFNSEKYVDVTESLFNSVKRIRDNKVIKLPYFNLLEGTRAVEIGNAKLDTGLIELSEKELKFDTSAGRSEEEVIGVMIKLLKSVISWFNNSSLPVTVCSCRYVQTILGNYKGKLTDCTFVNTRDVDGDISDSTSTEWKLVNRFLKSFVLAIIKFVGLCLEIACETLYEEEDIITRDLDMNFLTTVPAEQILKDVSTQHSIIQLESGISSDGKVILQALFGLSICLLKLPSITQISIPLFQNQTSNKIFTPPFTIEALKALKCLSSYDLSKYKAPEGSFSKYVQTAANNRSIPSELTSVSLEYCLNQLNFTFAFAQRYVQELQTIRGVQQFNQYLRYDISSKITAEYNGISRGLLHLFLVRDDRSLLGSSEGIESYCMRLLENSTCFLSQIFHPETWTSVQGSEAHILSVRDEVNEKVERLMTDIVTGLYHNMVSFTCNRCRQRQLNSRGITLWETLQVNSESLELDLDNKYSIGDRLGDSDSLDDQPALPLSSFVYTTKLSIMIDVALSGFELNLYKPYEMNWIHWFVSYLSSIFISFYKNRIDQLLNYKKGYITIQLPKRIKKQKAGAKKDALKAQHKAYVTKILPLIEETISYNNNFIIPLYECLKSITDALQLSFYALNMLNIIDLVPNFEMCSTEHIYNLRFKPWSAVGVPEIPTYSHYLRTLPKGCSDGSNENSKSMAVAFINEAISTLAACKDRLQGLVHSFERELRPLVTPGTIDWFQSLSKTCISHTIEFNSLIKQINGGIDTSKLKLEFGPGYNIYFPKLTIVPQSK
ncbi:Piso0_000442 [Millerozyma farinosa CBS 7064]|uniref:Piso0_000442 protein n=1 Tax=Pichia sorbitophila (strain ATCC MYA-4447 / BCRC 22081 / CBS 7064 / NBRC 10061 / NRRL Y-12695) TaxID=559304 RepID=G8YU03_PICSO|nr:Piso0_000442 [Millerozyma farinosa CBS 7064]CCE73404.1 Piso0_000442 [Millerozyma farinosa CBS 7064]